MHLHSTDVWSTTHFWRHPHATLPPLSPEAHQSTGMDHLASSSVCAHFIGDYFFQYLFLSWHEIFLFPFCYRTSEVPIYCCKQVFYMLHYEQWKFVKMQLYLFKLPRFCVLGIVTHDKTIRSSENCNPIILCVKTRSQNTFHINVLIKTGYFLRIIK